MTMTSSSSVSAEARLAFIGQPQVDLVDDGEAVAGAHLGQQLGQLAVRDRGAGGIAGRGHQHALGGGRQCCATSWADSWKRLSAVLGIRRGTPPAASTKLLLAG